MVVHVHVRVLSQTSSRVGRQVSVRLTSSLASCSDAVVFVANRYKNKPPSFILALSNQNVTLKCLKKKKV